MRFEALEIGLELIRLLRPLVAKLRTVDPELARQVCKAASSVPMNIEEGAGRCGKDRLYHYRIARGSAREIRGALRVSLAWGHLEDEETQAALECNDRLLRLIWGLGR